MLRCVSHRIATLTIIGLTLLSLAACSGSPKPIDVQMGEFSYKMSSTTAKAGDVTFKITNDGTVVHEFVVVQSDLAPADLPKNGEGGVDEDKLKSMGEQGDIEPGTTVDLTLNMHPGNYVIICNLPGHFAGGMFTTFTVTP